MNPSAVTMGAGNFSGADRTADLSAYLYFGATGPMFAAGQTTSFVTRPGLPVGITLPAISNFDNTVDAAGTALYAGASANFSHVLVLAGSGGRRLLPDDPPLVGAGDGRGLYEQVGIGTSSATLRRVDVDDDGHPLAPQCSDNNFGAQRTSAVHAISADGSRIFFSARPANPSSTQACQPSGRQLFARVNGSQTIRISAKQCQSCFAFGTQATFAGASVDGSRVFFTTTDQLTDQDHDFSADLYLYDFSRPEGERLSVVSAGDDTAATPGSGANVAGVPGISGLVQLSDDGSRVYFVARSVLTTDANGLHQTAVGGADNLYLYEPDSNTTSFVATLAAGGQDQALYGAPAYSPSQLADPAGRYLAFTTYAGIASGDDDGTQDVYRYDATNGELVRVSSGAGEALINSAVKGTATQSPPRRQVSLDGSRIVFSTPTPLQDDDTNGERDVYLWQDGGTTEMVSDGQDPEGVLTSSDSSSKAAAFQISQDGSEVAFATSRQLVGEDRNQIRDVYLARTGLDVTHTPTGELDPCVGDACQGPTPVSPALLSQGSRMFVGPGNVTAAPEGTGRAKGSVSVSRVKAVRGRTTKVKVRVSGAGRIRVSGSGLRRASKTTKKAGTYRVRATLSKRARRTLRWKHRVKVRATVRFTPKTGRSAVKRVHATFRLKKQHQRAAARSRAGR